MSNIIYLENYIESESSICWSIVPCEACSCFSDALLACLLNKGANADTTSLPSELTRTLTTIKDLDERSGGAALRTAAVIMLRQAPPESWQLEKTACACHAVLQETIRRNVELCLQKPSQSARKADADDAREVHLPPCPLASRIACY